MPLDLTACIREPFPWVLVAPHANKQAWAVQLVRDGYRIDGGGYGTERRAIVRARELAEQFDAPVVHYDDLLAYAKAWPQGVR